MSLRLAICNRTCIFARAIVMNWQLSCLMLCIFLIPLYVISNFYSGTYGTRQLDFVTRYPQCQILTVKATSKLFAVYLTNSILQNKYSNTNEATQNTFWWLELHPNFEEEGGVLIPCCLTVCYAPILMHVTYYELCMGEEILHDFFWKNSWFLFLLTWVQLLE